MIDTPGFMVLLGTRLHIEIVVCFFIMLKKVVILLY